MTDERRQHQRFTVNWRGRILLPNREIHKVGICDISHGGLAITFSHALSVGTQINIEFFVKYRSEMERIRAKTRVAFNTVLSDNRGAKLGLQFFEISKDESHILNNVLHMMDEAST